MTSKIRILVKYDHPNENKANQLLGIYSKLKIKIVNIETVKGGFVLLINDVKEAEKIFEESNIKAVTMGSFQPVLPQEIACQRTLFIRTSNFILSHPTTEILNELKSQNSELKIIEATKIDNSNYLKISVDNSNTADIILKHGILMFKLHIPGSSISVQQYIEIMKCFNCFTYNEHHTRNCKEPKSLKCTNCLGSHTYKDCKVSKNQISCYHCNGNHHTFAFSCKIRKELVQKLKKQVAEPLSYVNAARRNVVFERRPSAMNQSLVRQPLLPTPGHPRPSPLLHASTAPSLPSSLSPTPFPLFDPAKPPPPFPPAPFPLHPMTANLMIETMSKTVGVIQFALYNESKKPNSFLKTYQELCQSNNLPILNLGNMQPVISDHPTPPQATDAHSGNGELNDTSFLSASEESMEVSMIHGIKGPVTNSSSPINKSTPNENNPLCNVSGAATNYSCNNSPLGATEPITSSPSQITSSCLPTPHSPPAMPVPTSVDTSTPPLPRTNSSPKTISPSASLTHSSPISITPSASPTLTPPTISTPMTTNPNASHSGMASPTRMPPLISPPRMINASASPTLIRAANSSPLTSKQVDCPLLTPPTESPNEMPSMDTHPLKSPSTSSLPVPSPQVDSPQIVLGDSLVNSSPPQNGDEIQLFLLKGTKSASISQLLSAHKKGNVALENNGKIISNNDVIENLIHNRYSALRLNRKMVSKDQLNQILCNGMEYDL